jgi:Thioesterase-like superfamily
MAMDAALALDAPIFARDGAQWRPDPEAGGPFGGLHGGAVSGLIVAEMEREGRERGLGFLLSVAVVLLRPAPMAPLETRTELLRKGGRAGALETQLSAGGKLIAKGMGSFVAPTAVADTPAAPPLPAAPDTLPPWPLKPRFPHQTLFDALDLRIDAEGRIWGRLMRPLVPFASAMANAFAVADNGQPFSLGGRHDVLRRFTFPNIDIALHLSRPPMGGWIGVKARSDWRPEGMGLTESELRDETGPLGRCCQTIVLMPRG